jgi:hypothetical protein
MPLVSAWADEDTMPGLSSVCGAAHPTNRNDDKVTANNPLTATTDLFILIDLSALFILGIISNVLIKNHAHSVLHIDIAEIFHPLYANNLS